MQPDNSSLEAILRDLLAYQPERVSAKQTNIQIATKLPHGTLITKSRVTVITRTGHIDKTFALKGVSNEF